MKTIWIGASSLATKLLNKWLKVSNKYLPDVILDNDINKAGTLLKGIPVDLVSNIQHYLVEDCEIIITSSYVSEIKAQLEGMNITNAIDYKEKDREVSVPILSKNNQLYSRKNSNRCFVIGNAPSLNSLDLNKILKEDKIMVNSFYKKAELLDLKPNFWVLADPIFWLNEEELLYPILNVLDNSLVDTQLFIKDEALLLLERDIYHKDNVYFYNMNDSSDTINDDIDLTRAVPQFAQNVISPALMLAIYLKYEEIILIGCDHTWWGYSKEEIEQGIIHPHIYSKSERDKVHHVDFFQSHGYEGVQETIERQKYEYMELDRVARRKGIKIINATNGGYLETFERVAYEDLFK